MGRSGGHLDMRRKYDTVRSRPWAVSLNGFEAEGVPSLLNRRIIVVFLLGMLLFSGCLWAPNLDRLKQEIQAQIPDASFDKEVSFTLGPVTLGIARIFSRFIPEANEARGYLDGISRVEVAVYETESLPSLEKLRFPKRLQHLTEKEGWELAAKVREEDNVVWILFHEKRNRINSLYVVVLDEENLVLVRLKGNLEKAVMKGLREAEILKDT